MFNQQLLQKNGSQKLTIEKLRSYPGFEEIEEKEAEELIRSIELYCELVIQLQNEK
ncbi:MAG: hypothetical protein R2780_14205 [Crocinitomicaceae bacterium]